MATLGEYLGRGSGTTRGLRHLNEASGTSVTDSSGNGNTGTASSASRVSGKFGRGFNTLGNRYISAANSTSLNITGNKLTLAAWVKITSLATGYVIDKGEGTTMGYALVPISDGTFAGAVHVGTSKSIFSTSTLSTGVWYHIAFVYNGTDIRLYKNGSLDCTPVACTGNITTSATKALTLGATTIPNVYFNGVFDECIVENIDWSAIEMKKYYANAKGRFATI